MGLGNLIHGYEPESASSRSSYTLDSEQAHLPRVALYVCLERECIGDISFKLTTGGVSHARSNDCYIWPNQCRTPLIRRNGTSGGVGGVTC